MSKRRASTIFIFVTIMLDMLSLGMMAPVLAKLIAHFTGSISGAAWWVGVFGVVWAVMQFFFSPLLGMLSDRVGRRPVVLLSNLGTAIDYTIMALAPNLGWLFAGRVLSGATTASITVANAYIADVTEPEKRAAAFGILGTAFGLGFILGPALGGFLGNHDPRLTFWVAAGLSLVNFLYGLVVLPESLAHEHRTARLDWKRANPFGSIKILRRHHELWGLSVVNFFGYLAHEVYPTVWVLYCIAVFGWSTGQIGLSFALVGITSIGSSLLVGPVVKLIGERKALLAGLVVAVGEFIFFGSTNGWIFIFGIIFGTLGLYGPPAQALMTRHVGPSEQGELQGAISCVQGITMMIGPGIFATVFAQFIGPWRHLGFEGAPWYLAAAMMFVALIVGWRVTTREDDVALPTPVDVAELNPTE